MNITIDDAIRRLNQSESDMAVEDVPVALLRVEPDGLAVHGRHLDLPHAGLERFCRHLGAPGHYLSTLDPGVVAPVLQHHLDRGDLGEGRVTLITRNSAFVAFGRSDLARLTSQQVVEAVTAGIGRDGADLHVSGLRVSDEGFELDLLGNRTAEEVVPGDILRGGLRVSHSLVGAQATQIESYVLRLICSNGMTHRECAGRRAVRTRRLPVDRPEAVRLQITQVERLASQAWGTLRNKLEAFRLLREERVEIVEFLQRWLERARLSPRNLMPHLQRAWEEEGSEANAYAAVNVLTRVATHYDDVPLRQRQILSRLAGLVSFRRLHICPHCFSLLSGTVPD
jgi:hypothetical protein